VARRVSRASKCRLYFVFAFFVANSHERHHHHAQLPSLFSEPRRKFTDLYNDIVAPQRDLMTRRQLQTVLQMNSSEASAADLQGTFDAMFRFYPPPATTLFKCADDSAAICADRTHAGAATHRCLLNHFDLLDGRFLLFNALNVRRSIRSA
jgi:hypothetical protein